MKQGRQSRLSMTGKKGCLCFRDCPAIPSKSNFTALHKTFFLAFFVHDVLTPSKVKHADWIKVVEIEEHESVAFSTALDAEEAKAIELAIKQNADLILLDGLAVRRAASAYGIEVTVTFGLLLQIRIWPGN